MTAQLDLFRAPPAEPPGPSRPSGGSVAELALDALRVPGHLRPGATAWRVLRGRPRCPACRGGGFVPFEYPAKAPPGTRCPKCDFGRLDEEAWIAERQIVAEILLRFTVRGGELRVRWHDDHEDAADQVYADEGDARADAAARPDPAPTRSRP